MTRDDIIKLAQEAYRAYMEWADGDDPWRREHGSKYYEDQAIKKAALVAVDAEREACAKLAASKASIGDTSNYPTYIAAAIRARSQV